MRTSTVRFTGRRVAGAFCLLFTAICSGAVFGLTPAPAEAKTAKVCAMLSLGELHSWFGKAYKVRPTENIPNMQRCAWAPIDGSIGTVLVQIMPRDAYSTASTMGKPKKLPGIGDQAYMGTLFDGWTPGALKGNKTVTVAIPHGVCTEKTAIAVLKTLVSRL